MKKSDDDVTMSAVFKSAMERIDEIKDDAKNHQANFTELLESRDGAIIGQLLKCHLLLEHYLDEYLKASNPGIDRWQESRLSFNQKLELAVHPNSVLVYWGDGIRVINRIRNRFAHNLNGTFEETELDPLKPFIMESIRGSKQPMPTGIDLIEKFTTFACASISSVTVNTLRYGNGKGYAGFQEWQEAEVKKHSKK